MLRRWLSGGGWWAVAHTAAPFASFLLSLVPVVVYDSRLTSSAADFSTRHRLAVNAPLLLARCAARQRAASQGCREAARRGAADAGQALSERAARSRLRRPPLLLP